MIINFRHLRIGIKQRSHGVEQNGLDDFKHAVATVQLASQPRETVDVQSNYENHKAKYKTQAQQSKSEGQSLIDWLSKNALVNQKHHVPAVENRDRKEIDNGKIGAEQGKENKQPWDAFGGL